jgi:hypothetical protein
MARVMQIAKDTHIQSEGRRASLQPALTVPYFDHNRTLSSSLWLS